MRAPGLLDQPRLRAFRAERSELSCGDGARNRQGGFDAGWVFGNEKACLDHVPLDDVADRGHQGRTYLPFIHWPPRGSKTCFSSSATKRDLAAAAEHRADHAGQRHHPGVVLQVLAS